MVYIQSNATDWRTDRQTWCNGILQHWPVYLSIGTINNHNNYNNNNITDIYLYHRYLYHIAYEALTSSSAGWSTTHCDITHDSTYCHSTAILVVYVVNSASFINTVISQGSVAQWSR